ncbi:MAG: hypothetical protein M3460_29595, partial [Actinomycetota bacterium]|nr:hypothetical protein [Actinomycetota bacterium]
QDVLSATGDDKTAASGIFYPAKINTHERDQRVAELSNRVPQGTAHGLRYVKITRISSMSASPSLASPSLASPPPGR